MVVAHGLVGEQHDSALRDVHHGRRAAARWAARKFAQTLKVTVRALRPSTGTSAVDGRKKDDDLIEPVGVPGPSVTWRAD